MEVEPFVVFIDGVNRHFTEISGERDCCDLRDSGNALVVAINSQVVQQDDSVVLLVVAFVMEHVDYDFIG